MRLVVENPCHEIKTALQDKYQFINVQSMFDYTIFCNDAPYDEVKKVVEENSNYYIFSLKDGSLIAKKTTILSTIDNGITTTSSYDGEEEEEFRDRVNMVLSRSKLDFPLDVKYNWGSRFKPGILPKIIITPYEIYRNCNTISNNYPTNKYIPIFINGKYEFMSVPNYVDNTYMTETEDIDFITTPLAIICKNSSHLDGGVGNTVILNSIMYNSNTDIVKTLFQYLEEEVFWEEVLFPLLTEDFSFLGEKIKSERIPDSINIKLFKLVNKSALNEEIVRLKEEKRNSINAIETLIKNITSHKVQVRSFEEKIVEKTTALKNCLQSSDLEEEVKRLLELPYIEDVVFDSPNVKFFTGPIQIDEGPYLGGYEIAYNAKNKELKIKNVFNPKFDLAHPHIPQDGNPCFGNYTDIFFRFEVGEFYIGIELLHAFLSTYNPEDEWGRRLIYWDAQYTFEDLIERDMLSFVEDFYDSVYYEIYQEHLPYIIVCPICGEIGDDCECARCPQCGELLEDCWCDRCDVCDMLLDPNGIYVGDDCTCDRCPDNYDILVDNSLEGVCSMCENWTCEFNSNPHRPATQEETLFDEVM